MENTVINTAETKILVTNRFLDQFEKLETLLQDKVLEAIRKLVTDPGNQGLSKHRLERITAPNKWEAYINNEARIVYEPADKEIYLWQCGHHDIVDRIKNYPFSISTKFLPYELEGLEEPTEPEKEEFQIPEDWLKPRDNRKPDNIFESFPPTYLRVLGVPAGLIKAVKKVRYLEDLENIPHLPANSLRWMLDLSTDPTLAQDPFDPSLLVFRSTLDRLEGYCKGKIGELMLNLSPEQDRLVPIRPNGVTLVRGCAGSGKTTVAVYRAVHFAEKSKRVILLSYNSTLAKVANTLVDEITGALPKNLEITNIDSWETRFLHSRKIDIKIIGEDERRKILAGALQEVNTQEGENAADITLEGLKAEIDQVIKSNALSCLEDYVNFPRTGLGRHLKKSARAVVWKMYEHSQKAMEERRVITWMDVPLLALRELQREPLSTTKEFKPYDHVVIDEAQDLSAAHLKVAVLLTVGDSVAKERSLFLVGDIAQRIYNPTVAWKQAGLATSGRGYALRKNFRNTKQVAEAADQIAKKSLNICSSNLYVNAQEIRRSGPKPFVITCDTQDREPQAVKEKILTLIGGGFARYSDFAVLCPMKDIMETYKKVFDRDSIPYSLHSDEEFNILENQVKIVTVHSAKGLEFPFVFLTGLHNGVLPRKCDGSSPEEIESEMEIQRTLMYVGMTRAAEILYLVTSDQNPSHFLSDIGSFAIVDRFEGGKKD